jgi:hypothetical protein
MSDIEFFWPRAWLCLSGFVLTVVLVAVTNKNPSRDKQPAPLPPGWLQPWLVLWRAAFATYITRPDDVTREPRR